LFQAGGVSRCLMMGPGPLTIVSAPGPIAIGLQYWIVALYLSLPLSFSSLYYLFTVFT
jgi:hypothetical protein